MSKAYTQLPSKEDEAEGPAWTPIEIKSPDHLRPRYRLLSARSLGYLAEFMIVGVAAIIIIITTFGALLAKTPGRPGLDGYDSDWKSCGHSLAEAKEAGCVFDLMLNSWVPPECYQKDLSDEFIETGQYRFYWDDQATWEAPVEIVKKGEHTAVYTGPVHHFDHCAFMWRLQARALDSRGPIDTESLDYNHTIHCAEVLKNFYIANSTNYGNESMVGVGFSGCRHYSPPAGEGIFGYTPFS